MNHFEKAIRWPMTGTRNTSRWAAVRLGLAFIFLLVCAGSSGCRGAFMAPEEAFKQAMTFTRPADRIVFDRNWTNPGSFDYAVMPRRFHLGVASALRAPACWVRLVRATENRHLPAWTPLIFLHGRRAAGSDEERLVALELESRFTGDGAILGPGPELWVIVKVLGRDDQGQPTVLYTNKDANTMKDTLDLGPLQDSKVFAGQPDPADPSHFVIKIRTKSRGTTWVWPYRVDGWLQKDGSVRLTKVKDGEEYDMEKDRGP